MYKYTGKIEEMKDVEPHAGQYSVYHVTCPFCGYECEVHAVGEIGVCGLYPKCRVCGEKFWREGES